MKDSKGKLGSTKRDRYTVVLESLQDDFRAFGEDISGMRGNGPARTFVLLHCNWHSNRGSLRYRKHKRLGQTLRICVNEASYAAQML